MTDALPRDIPQTVTRILAEQALVDPSEVSPDMSLADLGIDSLGIVEAIFAIEETFDVSVPFNANNRAESDFDISSVASVIAAVTALVAAK